MVYHVNSPVATARRLLGHSAQAVALKWSKELGKTGWHTSDHLAAVTILWQQQGQVQRWLLFQANLTTVCSRQTVSHVLHYLCKHEKTNFILL